MRPLRWLLLANLLSAAACSASPDARSTPPTRSVTIPQAPPEGAPPAPVIMEAAAGDGPWSQPPAPRANGGGPAPISTRDATWGEDGALVTLMVFVDYECPFCGVFDRNTLATLHHDRAPDELRIVQKHYPLKSHPHAKEAALSAVAVFAAGGMTAFDAFHQTLFANQGSLDSESFLRWANEAGVSTSSFDRYRQHPGVAETVEADLALGEKLGLEGVPFVLANCRRLESLDLADVDAAISEERRASVAAVEGGVPLERIYAARCKENLR